MMLGLIVMALHHQRSFRIKVIPRVSSTAVC